MGFFPKRVIILLIFLDGICRSLTTIQKIEKQSSHFYYKPFKYVKDTMFNKEYTGKILKDTYRKLKKDNNLAFGEPFNLVQQPVFVLHYI